jgi:hypothetical protein
LTADVEDDTLDTIDIKRSLDKMKIIYALHLARNGEEAIEMLKGDVETTLRSSPDIVLIRSV